MARARTTTVKIEGSSLGVSLEDLRWMVAELEGSPGSTIVSVHRYSGDQRDPGSTTLSANKVST